MLKIENIAQFAGFGDGARPDEYFFSQGMKKSRHGISPAWKILKNADGTDLPTLDTRIKWFTQGKLATINYMFGMDEDGNIYSSQYGSGTFILLYRPGITINAGNNGLITDQKGRLLYFGERYLGMYDPTLSDYNTGTVEVTNGLNTVVGTGTTFTAGMTGKRFKIAGDTTFYTFTFTDTTHGTLSSTYSGAGGSGKSYNIYVAWTDQWKDMGSTLAYSKSADTYEDTVLITAGNKLVSINTVDDSINTSAFDLPSGFTMVDVDSGKNGILIGATFGNYCITALWDNISDRAVTDWIWYEGEFKSIANNKDTWIITTSRGIFETNGYTSTVIKLNITDEKFNAVSIYNLWPQGTFVISGRLLFWGQSTVNFGQIRGRTGLYILDLSTNLLEFVPVISGATYNIDGGAIGSYVSGINNINHLSYDDTGTFLIASLQNLPPTTALLITSKVGQGNNEKVAEAVKINLEANNNTYEFYLPTFDISLKLYNFKRQLCGYVQQKVLATSKSEITVDGTITETFKAQVGDEITILEGDNAGQIRHIASITGGGTATEVWTLDSALPEFTEAGMNINVSPFKLVRKYSFTSLTEIKDLYFDVKNKIKGRNFLIKLLFENLNSPIEIQGISFIYNDLGII